MRKLLNRFARNERGAMLAFFALAATPAIGMTVLAMDIARLYDLQSQLQKGADACALAAAAELDGRANSQDRATAAAITAATALGPQLNSSFWGGGVNCGTLLFYSSLPATDDLAMGTPLTNSTTDQQASRFVAATASPVAINTIFPITMLGAVTNQMSTTATAVAGFTQTICRVTPIAVCNPTGLADLRQVSTMRGRELAIVQQQNTLPTNTTTQLNMLWVDMLGCGTSGPCLEHHLGWNVVPACKRTDEISVIQGVKAGPQAYYNTRFDLQNPPANNPDTTVYSPDINVRKGYINNNFQNPPVNAYPLPDDSAIRNIIVDGTGKYTWNAIEALNGKIGTGDWATQNAGAQYSAYNTINFNGALPPYTPSQFPSRYALYQYELGLLSGSTDITGTKSNNGANPFEIGKPINAPANALADRRLVYAIVEDCSGSTINLGAPQMLLKLFALHPLEDTGNNVTLYAEYVDIAIANSSSGVLHDEVQLYR